MASVNKVIILGNAGRDAEVRHTTGGSVITNVSLATTRKWKDKQSGERREETDWHRIVFFGKVAEIAGEYVKKGKPVYVEGRLTTRKWTDKEGRDQWTTEIVADQLQLLGGRDDRQDSGQTRQAPANTPPPPNFDDMDDDIPF